MMQQLTLLGHTLPKSADALTPSQLKILFTLDFLGVPTPMSRLSAKLSVTPGTLTRVASGLRRKGYLERRRSAADDRVVNLSLTNRGQRAVGRIKQYRGEFFANLCATLSHADCQRLIESHRYILETYRRILQQNSMSPESLPGKSEQHYFRIVDPAGSVLGLRYETSNTYVRIILT